jgi:hypothetical protein
MRRKPVLQIAIVACLIMITSTAFGQTTREYSTSLVFAHHGDYKILEFQGQQNDMFSFNISWPGQVNRINMFLFQDYNVINSIRCATGTTTRNYSVSWYLPYDGTYQIFLFRASPADASETVNIECNFNLVEPTTPSGIFTSINVASDCMFPTNGGMTTAPTLHFDEAFIGRVNRDLKIFYMDAGRAVGTDGDLTISLLDYAGSIMAQGSGTTINGVYILMGSLSNGNEAHVIGSGMVWPADELVFFSNTMLYPGPNFLVDGEIPTQIDGFDFTWLFMSIAVATVLIIVKARKRTPLSGH